MDRKLATLSSRLKDERSKKVMFVSHCILNENTRFMGGAFRKGGVDEVVGPLLAAGVGIVQMPCPERECWGGVLKKDIMRAYGSKGTFSHRFYKALLDPWIWNARRKYRKLSSRVAREIKDYRDSGFEVMGIIGIDGSPSCGVNETLDMRALFDKVSRIDIGRLTTGKNNQLVAESAVRGEGYFIQELKNALRKRNLQVGFYAHSLLGEIRGDRLGLKSPESNL